MAKCANVCDHVRSSSLVAIEELLPLTEALARFSGYQGRLQAVALVRYSCKKDTGSAAEMSSVSISTSIW